MLSGCEERAPLPRGRSPLVQHRCRVIECVEPLHTYVRCARDEGQFRGTPAGLPMSMTLHLGHPAVKLKTPSSCHQISDRRHVQPYVVALTCPSTPWLCILLSFLHFIILCPFNCQRMRRAVPSAQPDLRPRGVRPVPFNWLGLDMGKWRPAGAVPRRRIHASATVEASVQS